MVSKLDEQNFTSDFEFPWVPRSYGFVTHLSKIFSKLQLYKFHIFAQFSVDPLFPTIRKFLY